MELIKKSLRQFERKLVEEKSSGVALTDLSPQNGVKNAEFSQDIVVGWQEKLQSPTEFFEHRRSKPKRSEDGSRAQNRRRKTRIFTMVNEDQRDFQLSPPTTSKADYNMNVRSMNRAKGTDQQEHFLLMADLSPEESYGQSADYEVILCQMTWDSLKRQLRVEPDFSRSGAAPQRITGIGAESTVYEYSLHLIQPDEIGFETLLQPKLKKLSLEDTLFEFDEVSEGDKRLVFVGEISRAENFPINAPMYVFYQLHLPEGWISECEDTDSGLSEACLPSYDDQGKPNCHFSFPLNFSFIVNKKRNAFEWPYLAFTCFAKHILTNDTDVGFGSLQLPFPNHEDNNNEVELKMWRASDSTPEEKLRRFFLGGIQLMTNVAFFKALDNQKRAISRLGFRTERSGSLWIRLHSLVQTSTEKGKEEKKTAEDFYHPQTLAAVLSFQKSLSKLRKVKKQILEEEKESNC